MDKLKTIAWDVDDVLNTLTREWFDAFTVGSSNSITYNELSENPPHGILRIKKQEYLTSLDNFRVSSYSKLEPNCEILGWFEEYGANYTHIALTAVPFKCVSISAQWCMNHFGKWIRSYNYVPSFRADDIIPKYDTSKKEFLKRSDNVDILIDDSETNIQEAASIGIKTILFPTPWNSNRNQSIQDCLQKLTEIMQE